MIPETMSVSMTEYETSAGMIEDWLPGSVVEEKAALIVAFISRVAPAVSDVVAAGVIWGDRAVAVGGWVGSAKQEVVTRDRRVTARITTFRLEIVVERNIEILGE